MLSIQTKKTQLEQERLNDRQQQMEERRLNKNHLSQIMPVGKDDVRTVEKLFTRGNMLGFISIMLQMKPLSDWPYGIALFFAILKDILDILSLTGILYIVVIIITILCSIFIGLMCYLGDIMAGMNETETKLKRKDIRKKLRSFKNKNKGKTIKYIVLLGGTTIELIAVVDLLPIETLTLIIMYGMLLLQRYKEQLAEKELAKQPQISTQNSADNYYEDSYVKAA